MDSISIFRAAVSRCLLGLIFLSFLATAAYPAESEDAQIFITGFNAFQKRDYQGAVDNMSLVLQKYPDTPLRDMAIFWLARANYKVGNRPEAAKYMAKFFREYPDSPLKGTVEDDLAQLARAYEKGEELPPPPQTAVAAKRPPAAGRVTAPPAEASKPQMQVAAAEKATQEASREKADAERFAAEKAAAERSAKVRAALKEKAEAKARLERQTAEQSAAEAKAAEDKALQEAEAKRVAEEKARQEAEATRVAAERAAAEKAAAEKAAAERAVALKAAEEQAAAAQAAAMQKAAEEKAAAEQLAAARRAAEEKAAAEQAAVAQKAAEEKAAAERLAAAKKAAEEKAAAAQAAAAQKAAEEKAAAERVAAAKKAAEEKAAAAQAAAMQKAAEEKAAVERVAAAKKAAEEKAAAAQAAAVQKAAEEKAAVERVAAAKKAAEEKAAAAQAAAAQKAAEEKAAAEQVAAARKAAEEKAAAERAAAQKAEQERMRLAKQQEELVARERAAKAADTNVTRAKATALREKAIAEYKDLIDRFPGTAAAAIATAKLSELGISYGGRPKATAGSPPANAKVLTFEVAQAPGVGFGVQALSQPLEVGKRARVPFEIINKGNGPDSFYLESGFPSAFEVQFSAAEHTDIPVNVTPSLAPGQKFSGTISLTVPPGYIDGARIVYPVKAASQLSGEASQSRDIPLVASAPLLRMVIKPDKSQVLPGEKVTYRVTLLNIGSSAARALALRFNYPPQYEPVDYVAGGFKQEMKAALVREGVDLPSGQSRDYAVTFQLKEEALAQQALFLRGEVSNSELQTTDSFVSTATLVQSVTGVGVRVATNRFAVIPGQKVSIPVTVTNTGNITDDFSIGADVPSNVSYTFYLDLNRDGIKQPAEPVINHVGPLAPREESSVLMELTTSSVENDGVERTVALQFEPESNRGRKGTVQVRLLYSRPVVELTLNGKGGRLRPGEVSSVDLTFTNRGSNMAKMVELESILPAPLEFVASDPPFVSGKGGEFNWKVEELGPGEKRSVTVSFRLKPEAPVGTSIQLKNVLKYQDQLGNRY